MDLEQETAIRDAVIVALRLSRLQSTQPYSTAANLIPFDRLPPVVERTYQCDADAAIAAHLKAIEETGYVIVPISEYRELLMFRTGEKS